MKRDEFNQHFIDSPNVNPPFAPQISLASDDPSSTRVTIYGACPMLDQSTGQCLIQEDKPLVCRSTQPKEFAACAKAPGGRWNTFLEK